MSTKANNAARRRRRLRDAFDVLMRAKSGSDGMSLEGTTPLAPAFAIGYALTALAHALEEMGDTQAQAIVNRRFAA